MRAPVYAQPSGPSPDKFAGYRDKRMPVRPLGMSDRDWQAVREEQWAADLAEQEIPN